MQQVATIVPSGAVFGGQQLCAREVFARKLEHNRAGAVMIASTINTFATRNLTLLVITVSVRYPGFHALRCDLNHTSDSPSDRSPRPMRCRQKGFFSPALGCSQEWVGRGSVGDNLVVRLPNPKFYLGNASRWFVPKGHHCWSISASAGLGKCMFPGLCLHF
jgi:hypothetical protein